MKGFGPGVISLKGSHKICFYGLLDPEFPGSGDKDVSLSPGPGRVRLTGEIISCFQRDSGGPERPSYTGCFLIDFNLK